MTTVVELPLVHSEECKARVAEAVAAREAWLQAWPNHCKKCEGEGQSTYYQSLGPGIREPITDSCICTEQSICPRCGVKGLTDEENGDDETGAGPCKSCGWNYDSACPATLQDLDDGMCGCEYARFKQIRALVG